MIKVKGVPWNYEPGVESTWTISIEAAGSTVGGFLLNSTTPGTFTWAEDAGIRPSKGSGLDAGATTAPAEISQNDADRLQWVVSFTPDEDASEPLYFTLFGNAVNGDENSDEGDRWAWVHFNMDPLAPGDAARDDSERVIMSTDRRTIDEGEDPEASEGANQAAAMEWVFTNGSLAYFASLTLLIVAAVFQREIFERREGGGPIYLAKEIALPQGVKRGVLAVILLGIGSYGVVSNWPLPMVWILLFSSAWATYGVYRSTRMARAPPAVSDMV